MGATFTLVKRACISCPATPPVCNCAANENCIITVQSCEQCPQTICSPVSGASSSPTGSGSSGGGVKAGPIAGGVVGGLAAFAIILAFLLWKFVYSESARKKRQEEMMMLDQEFVDSNLTPNVDAEAGFFEKQRMSRDTGTYVDAEGKSVRLSSVTMSSINTGRGSNIIPIAYIPGVTSRQQQNHPEQFFSASDILRESQISNDDNIRASIATTNYRGSAYVPSDVVTAVPMRPNLVEVGGSGSGSGGNGKARANPGLTLNTQQALENGDLTNRNSTNSLNSPTVFQSAQAMRLSGAKSIRIGKSQPIGLQSEFIPEEEDEQSEKDHYSGRFSRITRTASQLSNAVLHRTTSNRLDNDIKEEQSEVYGSKSIVPSNSLDLRFSTSSAFDVQLPFLNDDPLDSKPPRPSRPGSSVSSRPASRASRLSHKTNRESVEYVADNLPQEAYLYATSPHLLGAGDGEFSESVTPPQAHNQSDSSHSYNSSVVSSLSEKAADNTTLIRPNEETPSPFDDKYEHK